MYMYRAATSSFAMGNSQFPFLCCFHYDISMSSQLTSCLEDSIINLVGFYEFSIVEKF